MRKGWKNMTWGEIATLEYGKSLRDYQSKQGDVPVYGTNGLIGCTDKTLCSFPSVIVGRKGAYRGIHYSSRPFFVIDTAFYLKPKTNNLDLKYAYYQLLTQDINSMDSGSAIPSTSREDFYNLELNLPPLPTQRRIASILSALDDKIELNRQTNQTLEAIAQAIFKEWFVTYNFPTSEGKPYRDSDGEMQDSELGLIPKGWMVKKLGEHISFIKGKKPKETSEKHMEGFLPQILIETLDTGKYIFANPDNMVICDENDLIMVMDGASSGRVEFGIHGIVGSTLAIVKKVDFDFQYYLYQFLKLKEEDIKANTTGSSIPHADKHKINDYDFIIPDINILLVYEKIVTNMYQLIAKNKIESQVLAKMRDNLLPKLMCGDIEV